MAVVFQGIEGEKKGRMVIGCASVLRLGHGNTKTLLSFFPNNIGAKHFLRAKTLNSSNLTKTTGSKEPPTLAGILSSNSLFFGKPRDPLSSKQVSFYLGVYLVVVLFAAFFVALSRRLVFCSFQGSRDACI